MSGKTVLFSWLFCYCCNYMILRRGMVYHKKALFMPMSKIILKCLNNITYKMKYSPCFTSIPANTNVDFSTSPQMFTKKYRHNKHSLNYYITLLWRIFRAHPNAQNPLLIAIFNSSTSFKDNALWFHVVSN